MITMLLCIGLLFCDARFKLFFVFLLIAHVLFNYLADQIKRDLHYRFTF